MKKHVLIFIALFMCLHISAQQVTSKAWISDFGNGRYRNPVLFADYPSLDATKIGDKYYMVAESGTTAPGLPLLVSKDMVNWDNAGFALPVQSDIIKKGAYSPCIRTYKGTTFVFFANAEGIFMTQSTNMTDWTEPSIVLEGKNLYSPSPVWDEKGNLFLMHSYYHSMVGISNLLSICQVGKDNKAIKSSEQIIFDGNEYVQVHGAKIIKKNNDYYIFAAVGKRFDHKVLSLRSKNVYGPYESSVAMYQASNKMEGPYLGAYLETPSGEPWYLHNQHILSYGNVVVLNPVAWENGWVTVGGYSKVGGGEPITNYKKPNIPQPTIQTPADSDPFDGNKLGMQWQWLSQPSGFAYFLNQSEQNLRLYSSEKKKTLLLTDNILITRPTSDVFTMTTKMKLTANGENASCGIALLGKDYVQISMTQGTNGITIAQMECKNAYNNEAQETITKKNLVQQNEIYFRLKLKKNAVCSLSYSLDGEIFYVLGNDFPYKEMQRQGAKIAFFCTHPTDAKNISWCDIDFVEFEK